MEVERVSCSRCAERAAAIRRAMTALGAGDVEAVRREVAAVAGSAADDVAGIVDRLKRQGQ